MSMDKENLKQTTSALENLKEELEHIRRVVENKKQDIVQQRLVCEEDAAKKDASLAAVSKKTSVLLDKTTDAVRKIDMVLDDGSNNNYD